VVDSSPRAARRHRRRAPLRLEPARSQTGARSDRATIAAIRTTRRSNPKARSFRPRRTRSPSTLTAPVRCERSSYAKTRACTSLRPHYARSTSSRPRSRGSPTMRSPHPNACGRATRRFARARACQRRSGAAHDRGRVGRRRADGHAIGRVSRASDGARGAAAAGGRPKEVNDLRMSDSVPPDVPHPPYDELHAALTDDPHAAQSVEALRAQMSAEKPDAASVERQAGVLRGIPCSRRGSPTGGTIPTRNAGSRRSRTRGSKRGTRRGLER